MKNSLRAITPFSKVKKSFILREEVVDYLGSIPKASIATDPRQYTPPNPVRTGM